MTFSEKEIKNCNNKQKNDLQYEIKYRRSSAVNSD